MARFASGETEKWRDREGESERKASENASLARRAPGKKKKKKRADMTKPGAEQSPCVKFQQQTYRSVDLSVENKLPGIHRDHTLASDIRALAQRTCMTTPH